MLEWKSEGEETLCHLREIGDLKKEMKWEYWTGYATEASVYGGETVIAYDRKTARRHV